MSATTSGVRDEMREQQSRLLRTKLAAAARRVKVGDRTDLEGQLDKAAQAFMDGLPFNVEWLAPKNFGQLLSLPNPTVALLNQLASETPFYTLLDQVESACFLNPVNLAIARPLIAGLYEAEVSKEKHFTPPGNWKHLPVEEAVAAYQTLIGNIFGSKATLNTGTVLKLAKVAKAGEDTEGIPIWLKLTTLARLFEVKGDPLATTDEGREAYAGIVDRFVPEVGKAFTKVFTKNGFNNWRKGQLSAKHVILTPAGIATWQRLEQITDDDLCFAPGGADTGSNYSGHSVRLSRIKIVLAEKKFGQDCIMSGGTIATQPNRMSKFEYLGTDCPANAYSPDADGEFGSSLGWHWSDDELHFGRYWAGSAGHFFGSAAGRFA